MKRYSADTVMAGLKDFQRATVDHVIDRLYGPEPTRRFLVADETGLGKSLVARGVIAKALEHLQDDDSIARIDVVYVCSNQDIAAQNVGRLRVTSGESVTLSSRLTLLAKHTAQLEGDSADVAKPVNLVPSRRARRSTAVGGPVPPKSELCSTSCSHRRGVGTAGCGTPRCERSRGR